MLMRMANDYAKQAKDAHDFSTQAKESSARHSGDLKEMKRVTKGATQHLKDGRKRQSKRKARNVKR
jgi:hypothetical protein